MTLLANRVYTIQDKEGLKSQNIEEQSGIASRNYQKLDELVKLIIYGDEQTSIDGDKDWEKRGEMLRQGFSFLNLAFNVTSQLVNPFVQGYFTTLKGFGGRDYNLKDLKMGMSTAHKKVLQLLGDYQSKNPTSVDSLILERLGVFGTGLSEINLDKHGTFFTNMLSKIGYAGYKVGNALIQPGVAYTLMLNKKAKLSSGKEITFYDIFKKEGNQLIFDEEAVKAFGGEDAVYKHIAHIQNVIRKLSDNTQLSDKGALQAHWYGKFISMHRSWMVPMYRNMWDSFRIDPLTGRAEEGFIKTSWKAGLQILKPSNILQLKNLAFQFNYLTTKHINPSTGKPFTEDELALFKANIKQTITMVYTFALLMLAKRFLWDDEERKDSYSYYFTLRLQAELFSMLNPMDMLRVAKSPTAALNNLGNLGGLVITNTYGVITGDAFEVIESGPYKDWTKFEREWSRWAPVYNQYMALEKIPDKIKFMELGTVK